MVALHPSIAHIQRPGRIKRLPVDARGFPVPWFVATVDGTPDHRIVQHQRLPEAVAKRLCWICGERLLDKRAFLLGPMCIVNRTVSEPPSHQVCAEYAAQACPFLTRPHMHRREAGMPEDARPAAGIPLLRNPGCLCLWVTRSHSVERLRDAHGPGTMGYLFHPGIPDVYAWYCEGRVATRSEALTSLETGLPLLVEIAHQEGPEALHHLRQAIVTAHAFLPAA